MPKYTSKLSHNKATISNNYRFDTSYFPTTLDKALNDQNIDQDHEQKTVESAKEIVGDKYTTEEIKETITSFEYLINNWLEEYEKKIFNNKTLKELLQSI